MLLWFFGFIAAQQISSWAPSIFWLSSFRLLSLALVLVSATYLSSQSHKKRFLLLLALALSGVFWGLAHPLVAGLKQNFLTKILAHAGGGLQLAAWLHARIAALPLSIQPWVLGCVLGERLDWADADTWRRLGLLHVLVVSGLHVSLLGSCLLWVLRLPLRLLYSARLIQAGAYLRALVLADGLVVAALWVYASATGLGQAAQRAVLVFSLAKFASYYWGKGPFLWYCMVALCLQAGLFPYGFWSLATLMSWVAYVLVVLCFNRERQDPVLISLLTVHVMLLLFSGALFGGFSVFGILANILLVPATPFIFAAAYMLMAKELLWSPFYEFLVALQEAFLKACEKSAYFMDFLGFSYISISHHGWLRGLYLVCGLSLLLNFCWRESIRERAYTRNRKGRAHE